MSRKPKSELPKCLGPDKCPLRIQHPPNGEEYSLGCSICRNERANVKSFWHSLANVEFIFPNNLIIKLKIILS